MRRGRSFALVVVLALLGAAAPTSSTEGRAAFQQGRRPPTGPVSWLTTGDSYSAGEGATRATGRCQQSPNAGGPKAAEILRTERRWTVRPVAFTACTGDLSVDFFKSRAELTTAKYEVYGHELKPRPPDAPLRNDESLYQWTARQGIPPNRFDVIALSLGGNDMRFAEVVLDCLHYVGDLATDWPRFVRQAGDKGRCDFSRNDLMDRVDNLFDRRFTPLGPPGSPAAGQEGSLTDLYRTIADTMLSERGVLVVIGYPRLLSPADTWGRWRGDRCNLISRGDADMLGDVAERLDKRMRDAVVAAADGGRRRIEYVSRFQIFDDSGNHHSLCGQTVEWLNTPLLWLRDGTARRERGFHPNDLGYLATAEHVAGAVEGRLGLPAPNTQPAAGTSTTTSTVRSSQPRYEIGGSFNTQCTIAWPTAPARGVDSISMRTTCTGVPDQFLFVDITYRDRNLAVTPSRSTMRVQGRITDIVRSEFGYTTLVVAADRIVLL